ncbi:hypothetical protein [Acidianus ambivalens]|uniref:Uncharacterized protein n=1 Tax=Acidianus ambivalens TaxID=2283 RepID=A0A650CTG2_ACIAM|nr:hypothetical protein [Acidianus ambivalens]MQL56499.1 hypothetical protein [Acidianus ambivalens]QGR21130.1 hypothetical protein D1866_03220 [Acidianus ambivalens]
MRNNLVDEEKICDALNFVRNNIDKYSCLQCYISGDYDTGNCATSCIVKFRKSFCFDLNSVIKIIVIAEEYGGKVIMATFFPVTRNKDFERKCGNRFLHI